MMLRKSVYSLTVFFLSGCTAVPDYGPEGFSSFAFGSSHAYVQAEMVDDGYGALLVTEEELWYEGELYGYPVDFMYEFETDQLIGGIWDIRELTADAWRRVGEQLSAVYPNAAVNTCSSGSPSCRIYCTSDARIVHLLNADEDVHAVRYYEQSRDEECG